MAALRAFEAQSSSGGQAEVPPHGTTRLEEVYLRRNSISREFLAAILTVA